MKRTLKLPQWIINRVTRGKENQGFLYSFVIVAIVLILLSIGYFVWQPFGDGFLAIELIIIIALNLLFLLGAGMWLLKQFSILQMLRKEVVTAWENASSQEEYFDAMSRATLLGIQTTNKNRINY